MNFEKLDATFSPLGLYIKARHNNARDQREFSGICVYESKNMLYLKKEDGRIVKLPKLPYTFYLPDGTSVRGSAIVGRPVDRLVNAR